MTPATLGRTIPAVPARDVATSVAFSHARPVCSGAESFIAGTASCRIEVDDVTDFGTREFCTLDPDGNLITVYRWVSA